MTNDTLLDYTVLINQTAIHSVPAVINGVNSALLRAATGNPAAGIALTRHPLPVLQNERRQQVTQETGDTLLFLLISRPHKVECSTPYTDLLYQVCCIASHCQCCKMRGDSKSDKRQVRPFLVPLVSYSCTIDGSPAYFEVGFFVMVWLYRLPVL